MGATILVIEEAIDAALAVKNALAPKRQYTVYPFATAEAGLEFLGGNTVDVVIVNMHIPDYDGDRLVSSVRFIAPDAVLLAVTADGERASRATALGADGLLQRNYRGRDVLAVLGQIAPHLTTGSVSQPAAPPKPSDLPPASSQQESSKLFEKLSAEEPPAPIGGTITTFMMRVSDSELNNLLASINEVMEPLSDEEILAETDEEETQADTPAQFILEDAVGSTLPMEPPSFDVYLDRMRSGRDENYIEEPDFLEDETFEESAPEDPFVQTTQPSEAELERIREDSDNLETVTLPEEPLADIDSEPTEASQVVPPEEDERWQWGDEELPSAVDDEDPRITQMAVSLTQASLESTAEATILTQQGDVVAYEGELSDEDIQQVLQIIGQNQQSIQQKQGRVQFITLDSNGLNYLIYSRRTDKDFVLSMVFDGNTAITDIRQQAQRIAHAVESVPQLPPEDLMSQQAQVEKPEAKPSKGGLRLEASATAETGILSHYTFLWVPHDPDYQLEYAVSEAIDSGLRVQLVERGWKIESIDVQGDYVCVVAGVPGDEPPQSIVQNLQKRSAKIAQQQDPTIDPDTLWAESYFILTPGRTLNVQEIQQYINFYRMS